MNAGFKIGPCGICTCEETKVMQEGDTDLVGVVHLAGNLTVTKRLS